jgi:hypothetical protein
MSRGHEIYIKYSLHKLLCYGFHRTVERIKIFIVFSVENTIMHESPPTKLNILQLATVTAIFILLSFERLH